MADDDGLLIPIRIDDAAAKSGLAKFASDAMTWGTKARKEFDRGWASQKTATESGGKIAEKLLPKNALPGFENMGELFGKTTMAAFAGAMALEAAKLAKDFFVDLGKQLLKSVPALFMEIGNTAAQAFIGGLEALRSQDPMDFLNTFTAAMQNTTKAFTDFGSDIANTVPLIGRTWAAGIQMMGDAMQTATNVGGAYIGMLQQVGDEFLSISRQMAQHETDMRTVMENMEMVRTIMGSGAIDTTADIAEGISRFGNTLNLAGPKLQEFTQEYASFAEVVNNVNEVNVAGIMRAFEVPTDQLTENLTMLGNVMRETGGEADRVMMAMINSGPAFRALGYDMQETAWVFGKMVQEGERGTRMIYLINQVVEKIGKMAGPGQVFEDVESGWAYLIERVRSLAEEGQIEMARDIMGQFTTPQGATLLVESISRGIIQSSDDLSRLIANNADTYQASLQEAAAETTNLAATFQNIAQIWEASLANVGVALDHGIMEPLNKLTYWLTQNQDKVSDWATGVAQFFMAGAEKFLIFTGMMLDGFAGIVNEVSWMVGNSIKAMLAPFRWMFDLLEELPDKLGGGVFGALKQGLDDINEGANAIAHLDLEDSFRGAAKFVREGMLPAVTDMRGGLEKANEDFKDYFKVRNALEIDNKPMYMPVAANATAQNFNLQLDMMKTTPQQRAEIVRRLRAMDFDVDYDVANGIIKSIEGKTPDAQRALAVWFEKEQRVKAEIDYFKDSKGGKHDNLDDALEASSDGIKLNADVSALVETALRDPFARPENVSGLQVYNPLGVNPSASTYPVPGAGAAPGVIPGVPGVVPIVPGGGGGLPAGGGGLGNATTNQPGTQAAKDLLHQIFPDIVQIEGARHDPLPYHSEGRALDLTFGEIGRLPTAAEKARGDEVYKYLAENYKALGIEDLIWQGMYYRPGEAGGPTPYTGGSGPTQGHYDHIHISFVPGSQVDISRLNLPPGVTVTQSGNGVTISGAAAPPGTFGGGAAPTSPRKPGWSYDENGKPLGSAPGTPQEEFFSDLIAWYKANNQPIPPGYQKWDKAAEGTGPLPGPTKAALEALESVKTYAELQAFKGTSAYAALNDAEREALSKQVRANVDLDYSTAKTRQKTAELEERTAKRNAETAETKAQAAAVEAETAQQRAQAGSISGFSPPQGLPQMYAPGGGRTNPSERGQAMQEKGERAFAQRDRQLENIFGQTGANRAYETLKAPFTALGEKTKQAWAEVTNPQTWADGYKPKSNESATGSSQSVFGWALDKVKGWFASEKEKTGGGRYATGGMVHGPGTGTSDSVPALLSNGEFVHTAAAVNYYGPDFMHRINKRELPRFSDGGSASGLTAEQKLQKELLRAAFQGKGGRGAPPPEKNALGVIGDFLGGQEGGWKDKLSTSVANVFSGSFWLDKLGVNTDTENWNKQQYYVPVVSEISSLAQRVATKNWSDPYVDGRLSNKDLVDFFALPDAVKEAQVIGSDESTLGEKGVSALAMTAFIPGNPVKGLKSAGKPAKTPIVDLDLKALGATDEALKLGATHLVDIPGARPVSQLARLFGLTGADFRQADAARRLGPNGGRIDMLKQYIDREVFAPRQLEQFDDVVKDLWQNSLFFGGAKGPLRAGMLDATLYGHRGMHPYDSAAVTNYLAARTEIGSEYRPVGMRDLRGRLGIPDDDYMWVKPWHDDIFVPNTFNYRGLDASQITATDRAMLHALGRELAAQAAYRPTTASSMFRGTTMPKEVLEQIRIGEIWSLPPSSFALEDVWETGSTSARKFADPDWSAGWRNTGKSGHGVVLEIKPGASAMQPDWLNGNLNEMGLHELVAWGDFHIDKTFMDDGLLHVVLGQDGMVPSGFWLPEYARPFAKGPGQLADATRRGAVGAQQWGKKVEYTTRPRSQFYEPPANSYTTSRWQSPLERLADAAGAPLLPRRLSEQQAARLIAEGKKIYLYGSPIGSGAVRKTDMTDLARSAPLEIFMDLYNAAYNTARLFPGMGPKKIRFAPDLAGTSTFARNLDGGGSIRRYIEFNPEFGHAIRHDRLLHDYLNQTESGFFPPMDVSKLTHRQTRQTIFDSLMFHETIHAWIDRVNKTTGQQLAKPGWGVQGKDVFIGTTEFDDALRQALTKHHPSLASLDADAFQALKESVVAEYGHRNYTGGYDPESPEMPTMAGEDVLHNRGKAMTGSQAIYARLRELFIRAEIAAGRNPSETMFLPELEGDIPAIYNEALAARLREGKVPGRYVNESSNSFTRGKLGILIEHLASGKPLDEFDALTRIAAEFEDLFKGAPLPPEPPFRRGGLVGGFAGGGAVFGAGTATSDSIPAWLSNGEFVHNADAVNHYGTAFMHAVNNKELPRFAGGGGVDDSFTGPVVIINGKRVPLDLLALESQLQGTGRYGRQPANPADNPFLNPPSGDIDTVIEVFEKFVDWQKGLSDLTRSMEENLRAQEDNIDNINNVTTEMDDKTVEYERLHAKYSSMTPMDLALLEANPSSNPEFTRYKALQDELVSLRSRSKELWETRKDLEFAANSLASEYRVEKLRPLSDKKTQKAGRGDKDAQDLGRGLVYGIFEGLGFTDDVFGDMFTEWTLFKKGVGVLGYGLNLAQATGMLGGPAEGGQVLGAGAGPGVVQGALNAVIPGVDQSLPGVGQGPLPGPAAEVTPAMAQSQTPAAPANQGVVINHGPSIHNTNNTISDYQANVAANNTLAQAGLNGNSPAYTPAP